MGGNYCTVCTTAMGGSGDAWAIFIYVDGCNIDILAPYEVVMENVLFIYLYIQQTQVNINLDSCFSWLNQM